MNLFRRALLITTLCLLMPLGSAYAADRQPFEAGAFESAQAAGQPILVHVTAPWCGTCTIQKPIVAELGARPDFASLVIFDVDFDTQQEVLQALEVQIQSTMIAFKGREETARAVGVTDPAAIEGIMRKAF